MKTLLLIPLFFLIGCTATFRGTLVDIEELSIGWKSEHKGEKIIKEILTGDEAK
jgi:hypothetical protein